PCTTASPPAPASGPISPPPAAFRSARKGFSGTIPSSTAEATAATPHSARRGLATLSFAGGRRRPSVRLEDGPDRHAVAVTEPELVLQPGDQTTRRQPGADQPLRLRKSVEVIRGLARLQPDVVQIGLKRHDAPPCVAERSNIRYSIIYPI